MVFFIPSDLETERGRKSENGPSVNSIVFLNFFDPVGNILHNFLFHSSNLIYWYKKIPPLEKHSGEFIKRKIGLKSLENKGFFKNIYMYFQPKDGEGTEGLEVQVVIYLK
ncbi:hypothetical protein [Streptococcus parasanguinis]|uniref:hypothetical protein n=1 Tax=Streptococcus parasanguinis TaxID=1318 RepID=UPI0034A4E5AD